MGNPKHLEWLLAGVSSWNARRIHSPSLHPDFSQLDIRTAFEEADQCKPAQRLQLNEINFTAADLSGASLSRCDLLFAKMDRAVLNFADLSGANLLKASLRGAELRNAIVVGADLGETDLLRAELSHARLARAKLGNSKLAYANLTSARLRGADLFSSDLRHSNLKDADLRGADLRSAMVRSANMHGADVRTVFFPNPDGQGTSKEFTDLSATIGLVQLQLEDMRGDLGVILPEGLVYPAHWKEPIAQVRGSNGVDQPQSAGALNIQTVARALEENKVPIALTGLSLLTQLSLLRDQIVGDNELAATAPEKCEQMLDFVDDMIAGTHQTLDSVPSKNQPLTEEEAEEVTGFLMRWFSSAKDGFTNILDPEKLGHTTAPAAVVLGFGAFGYLASGFNVVGFGAGSLFGRWVAQDLKFGAASDKAQALLEEEEDQK